MVEFPGDGATLLGYLAKPTGDGPFPIILVCHENRGLTDHIKNVTGRIANEGYAALAVDLLSRQGGTAAITDEAAIPGALGQAPEGQPAADFAAGLRYMQSQPYADKAKVGMTGFCYGGGVTWRAATKLPELRAAVPFYGPAPQVADVPAINAAVLAFYGELDQRINAGIPEIEAAMQQNGKTYQKQIYPGANHAVFNDTGRNYNAAAAADAWTRMLAWFDQYVRA
jgi:carboxymethylenebutenolidase